MASSWQASSTTGSGKGKDHGSGKEMAQIRRSAPEARTRTPPSHRPPTISSEAIPRRSRQTPELDPDQPAASRRDQETTRPTTGTNQWQQPVPSAAITMSATCAIKRPKQHLAPLSSVSRTARLLQTRTTISQRRSGKGQVVNEITSSSTAATTSALPDNKQREVASPESTIASVSHSTADQANDQCNSNRERSERSR